MNNNRPLRIVMVAACPFPYPRGTPVRILKISEELAKRGHEIHVVTYNLGETTESLRFKVHRTPPIKSFRKYTPGPSVQKLTLIDTLLAFRLRQVLKRHHIDIIHAHHYEGILVASLFNSTFEGPIIYDAHTLLASELPNFGPKYTRKLSFAIGRILDRYVPRIAHHVVAVNEAIETELINHSGIAPEHISVIANGVEYELLAQQTLQRSSPNLVVFSGNFAPYQGIDVLLQAFHLVHAKNHWARLLIVSNDSFNPYAQLARELGIADCIEVVRVGFDQVPQQLARASIGVNPRECCPGIPQKLLNYMASGKAIVSFSGSGKVLQHKTSGLLVKDGDVSAFANAILLLLDRPQFARTLGKNAQITAAEMKWSHVALLLENLYVRELAKKQVLLKPTDSGCAR